MVTRHRSSQRTERAAGAPQVWPPTFPRIPHLVAGAHGKDDLVLSRPELRQWLGAPCIVEEKLDGANVALWVSPAGKVEVAGRAGPSLSDRAQQFGRLRAWAAAHLENLRALLGNGEVLYAEWLYRQHTVRYDALPDFLVALDVWSAAAGFAAAEERDRRCQAVGLSTPPILHRGKLGTEKAARALHSKSVFGREPAEGLVLRYEEAGTLVMRAKLVRPGFKPRSDAEWRASALRCNAVARGDDGGVTNR